MPRPGSGVHAIVGHTGAGLEPVNRRGSPYEQCGLKFWGSWVWAQ